MSDLSKQFTLDESNIHFNSIQSLKSTTISTLQTTAFLKTILANQIRIISKLESVDEDKLYKEMNQLLSANIEQTATEWTENGWMDVSPK